MTTHSQTVEDTLYSIIGLRDFASATEVEMMLHQFETSPEFADLRRSQLASGLTNVFSILLSPQSKQWYDLLLEAQLRSDGYLTPIHDPHERAAICNFAKELGIELVPVSEWVFRIRPIAGDEPESVSESAVRQFPVQLASIQIVFHGFTCKVASGYDFDTPQVVLHWQHGQSFPFRSGEIKIVGSGGDRVVLIGIDSDPGTEQFQAGYINRSQSVFSPLEHAGNSLFSGSREEVAERLGIRARPDSIRKAISQYYRQLANAICHFEPEIDRDSVEAACARFGKKLHSDW